MSAVEIFGTMFKPNVRWSCLCGVRTVTKLGVPIRHEETVHCRSCHRRALLTFDLATVPRVLGFPVCTPLCEAMAERRTLPAKLYFWSHPWPAREG